MKEKNDGFSINISSLRRIEDASNLTRRRYQTWSKKKKDRKEEKKNYNRKAVTSQLHTRIIYDISARSLFLKYIFIRSNVSFPQLRAD